MALNALSGNLVRAETTRTPTAKTDAAATTTSTIPTPGQPLPAPANQALLGTLDAALLKAYLVAQQPFGDMVLALQQLLTSNAVRQEFDPALFHRLEETLTTLLPRDAQLPDTASLREQVAKSGMHYEANVQRLFANPSVPATRQTVPADLKGQLLELLAKLDQVSATTANAQGRDTADVHQHVRNALQSIEFQQLSNLFAQQEGQPFLLQFAHPLLAPPHTAKLYVRTDAHKKRTPETDKQDFTLLLLLDFAALGPVRIDATVRGTSVTATIQTQAQAVADFITAHTPNLTARLHDLGFRTEVHCCAQEDVSLDVDDALTRVLLADPSRLVDITA